MEKLKVHFLSYWEKHLIKSQVAQLFLNELSPNKLFIIPQNNTNNTTNNNGMMDVIFSFAFLLFLWYFFNILALRIPLGTLHGKYISLLKREVELNYEERKSKNLLSKESSDAS